MAIEKDLSRFVKQLTDALADSQNKAAMRKLGLESIRMIKDHSRRGFGVKKPGGNLYKFPKLSQPYIAQRIRDKKKGKLSKFTTPQMSNVTRSGRLLASLDILKIAPGEPFIGPSGRSFGGNVTQPEVVGFLAKQGRIFLNLSRSEIIDLHKFYETKLLRV